MRTCLHILAPNNTHTVCLDIEIHAWLVMIYAILMHVQSHIYAFGCSDERKCALQRIRGLCPPLNHVGMVLACAGAFLPFFCNHCMGPWATCNGRTADPARARIPLVWSDDEVCDELPCPPRRPLNGCMPALLYLTLLSACPAVLQGKPLRCTGGRVMWG